MILGQTNSGLAKGALISSGKNCWCGKKEKREIARREIIAMTKKCR